MKQLNRWVYAIVGVIVLLFAGLVYAWSVLSTPIAAEFTGWTKAQLSLTFTLVMILFCIGSLLCGLLAGKLSAKNAVRVSACCSWPASSSPAAASPPSRCTWASACCAAWPPALPTTA